MAKKSDVTLLEPPRYTRNDPRNQARVEAGRLLSLRLAGYDYPIRKLRRVGGIRCVTLPPQVRKSLKIKGGDWLMFGEGPWPGTVWICKVTEEQYQFFRADGRKDMLRKCRKVQAIKSTLFVTIAAAVRKIMLVEVGDSLVFGLRVVSGELSISALKGGGDSAGSRRTG
ncbi:hypothetical protein ES707_04938 [subsurface metagenome]